MVPTESQMTSTDGSTIQAMSSFTFTAVLKGGAGDGVNALQPSASAPPSTSAPKGTPRRTRPIPAPVTTPSGILAALHRRHLAAQADVDARGGEAAVGLALRDREYLDAGLELAALGGREGHDHRAFGNQHLLLAALVLHREHAVLAHAGDVGHVGIGHLAGGPQVPVVVPFAGAAHGLRENVHFQRDQRAVAFAERRGADEFSAGEVGDARLGDADDGVVVRELDGHAPAIVGLA